MTATVTPRQNANVLRSLTEWLAEHDGHLPNGTLTARSRPPRLPEVHIYASEYDAIGRAREQFGPWNYRGDRYAEWHAADGVELTVYLARDEEWDA